MKNTLSKFFIFTLGAGVGSAITWHILKSYYDKLVKEEIESVKEVFRNRHNSDGNEDTEDNQSANQDDPNEEDKAVYKQLAMDYTNGDEEVTTLKKKPYIIPPEEFGERDGYDAETLTYYADGVLTYDTGEPVEDVDNVVGLGFEAHFGEFEDDSVHVRNEEYETDYEILRDLRKYYDVINTYPHRAEDE